MMRQSFGDLALQAAAEADQAPGVLRQEFLVDARLVVETFGVACRDELDQVVIALERFREEDQVVLRLSRIAVLCMTAPRRDVDLAAENRVEAACPRVVVKSDRREQIAML